MGLLKESLLLERAALGLINGVTRLQLNGYNGGVTTTHETLWPTSTAYTFLLVNASTPYVSAADANDTANGTGARTVFVEGVDVNFNYQSETISLNGQTSVNLTKSYMTINSMRVLTTGSGLKNAGIVYVGTGTNTAGVPAVIHETIPLGENVSQSLKYAVPADMALLVMGIRAASRSGTAGGHELLIEAATSQGPILPLYKGGFTNTAPLLHGLSLPFAIPEKTQFQAKTLATAGTGPAYITMDCLLFDKSKGALNL